MSDEAKDLRDLAAKMMSLRVAQKAARLTMSLPRLTTSVKLTPILAAERLLVLLVVSGSESRSNARDLAV
jgi:hypothetical protein